MTPQRATARQRPGESAQCGTAHITKSGGVSSFNFSHADPHENNDHKVSLAPFS